MTLYIIYLDDKKPKRQLIKLILVGMKYVPKIFQINIHELYFGFHSIIG